MEITEKIDITKRPKTEKGINDIPSCPLWILGNAKSCDNDLKLLFEIVD